MNKLNKKGAIEDIVLVMVSLFGLAVVMILAVYLANTFNTSVSPVFGNQSANSTIGFSKVNDIANTTFNYIYLMIFVVLLVAMIISAFLTPTHPIFFVFFIILFIVLMVASVVLSNAYESLAAAPVFATAVSKLAIPNLILSRLPLVTAVVGAILAVILFSRSSNPLGSDGVSTR